MDAIRKRLEVTVGRLHELKELLEVALYEEEGPDIMLRAQRVFPVDYVCPLAVAGVWTLHNRSVVAVKWLGVAQLFRLRYIITISVSGAAD